jgi:hypothetical protein
MGNGSRLYNRFARSYLGPPFEDEAKVSSKVTWNYLPPPQAKTIPLFRRKLF